MYIALKMMKHWFCVYVPRAALRLHGVMHNVAPAALKCQHAKTKDV